MRTKPIYWTDELLDSSDNTTDPKNACYTPKVLAYKIVKTPKRVKGNILDPCCGRGSLLAAALDVYKHLQEENIHGIDIDKNSIEFCRRYFPHGNFQMGNILEDDFMDDRFWEKPWNMPYKAYVFELTKPSVQDIINLITKKGMTST